MRLKLQDLQSDKNQEKKLQAAKLPEGWEDIKGVL